jgi:hypothetical protein
MNFFLRLGRQNFFPLMFGFSVSSFNLRKLPIPFPSTYLRFQKFVMGRLASRSSQVYEEICSTQESRREGRKFLAISPYPVRT